jgi:hypothetical protein
MSDDFAVIDIFARFKVIETAEVLEFAYHDIRAISLPGLAVESCDDLARISQYDNARLGEKRSTQAEKQSEIFH